MVQLDADNLAPYLAVRGISVLGPVTPLGGGVSNVVLRAETDRGPLVVKQALERLNVAVEWCSDPTRTLREAAALIDVAAILPAQAVPAVHFLDRANCIYAMDAASGAARDWKTLLLAGEIDPSLGTQVGRLLVAQIQGTRQSSRWREAYGDQRVFDELRLDPYYRFTASRHPDLAPCFDQAIRRCSERAESLVHGDWSPKNILVDQGKPMLIDYEVVHFGDPTFDVAFLLNHLLLKSLHRPEWASRYREVAAHFWEELAGVIDPAGAKLHLGCLHLARVDGKSPAEYLAESTKPRVRRLARSILTDPPAHILEVWNR